MASGPTPTVSHCPLYTLTEHPLGPVEYLKIELEHELEDALAQRDASAEASARVPIVVSGGESLAGGARRARDDARRRDMEALKRAALEGDDFGEEEHYDHLNQSGVGRVAERIKRINMYIERHLVPFRRDINTIKSRFGNTNHDWTPSSIRLKVVPPHSPGSGVSSYFLFMRWTLIQHWFLSAVAFIHV